MVIRAVMHLNRRIHFLALLAPLLMDIAAEVVVIKVFGMAMSVEMVKVTKITVRHQDKIFQLTIMRLMMSALAKISFKYLCMSTIGFPESIFH